MTPQSEPPHLASWNGLALHQHADPESIPNTVTYHDLPSVVARMIRHMFGPNLGTIPRLIFTLNIFDGYLGKHTFLIPPISQAPGTSSRGAGISVVGDRSDMGVPGVPTSVTWRSPENPGDFTRNWWDFMGSHWKIRWFSIGQLDKIRVSLGKLEFLLGKWGDWLATNWLLTQHTYGVMAIHLDVNVSEGDWAMPQRDRLPWSFAFWSSWLCYVPRVLSQENSTPWNCSRSGTSNGAMLKYDFQWPCQIEGSKGKQLYL